MERQDIQDLQLVKEERTGKKSRKKSFETAEQIDLQKNYTN